MREHPRLVHHTRQPNLRPIPGVSFPQGLDRIPSTSVKSPRPRRRLNVHRPHLDSHVAPIL